MNQNETGIPVLSIRDFDGQAGEFSHALGKAWREFGFVGIRDHGIDDALIERAYAAFREFFALPAELKQQYHQPGSGGARGYTGFGVEQAKDHDVPDLKEFWHVGREIEGENPDPEVLLPNLWPSDVADFKPAAMGLYNALDALGARILSALAVEIGLEADWFADKINYGNSILRPIHYPPIEQAVPGAVRAARHEDINLITLLIGSREQGLEILTRDGRWVPVSTFPGTIVVNVGDMLQRLTNHVYPSTTHQVVNPPGDAARQARYSIPFFLHPNPDFLIETLPECISEDRPNRYPEPITAHGYLMERLREIKLI
jgi:isopenicillin N synthase-like dioxygenase